jgi:hypothetical protein
MSDAIPEVQVYVSTGEQYPALFIYEAKSGGVSIPAEMWDRLTAARDAVERVEVEILRYLDARGELAPGVREDHMDTTEIRIWPDSEAGTFQVSDGGGWYPGIYASEEAARFVPNVDIAVLGRNVDATVRGVGDAYRPVTVDELKAWTTEVPEEPNGG